VEAPALFAGLLHSSWPSILCHVLAVVALPTVLAQTGVADLASHSTTTVAGRRFLGRFGRHTSVHEFRLPIINKYVKLPILIN
jgi:hypothetical protein